MYSGNTDKDCYSDIAAYTTGSYYDVMKESVFHCIVKVLGRRRKEKSSALTLADFGTGDGVNFLELLKDITRKIHTESGSTLQIMAYLDDQPSNDFNLLYSKYSLSNSDILGKKVYFATVGKTMYNQCLPPESVDIVVSSASLHWLSQIPCVLTDGLTMVHANVFERELFRRQAKEDWKKFLLSRGMELKTGGFMVLTITTSQEKDTAHKTMTYTSEVWKKMFVKGKISKEEYENTTLGFYVQRTDEDIRQPFNDPDIRKLGLRIVSLESKQYDLVPLQDRDVYASAVVDSVRPFIRNVIFYGLSEDRTNDDKNVIVEDVFTAMTNTVREGGQTFDFFIMKEVVVTKE